MEDLAALWRWITGSLPGQAFRWVLEIGIISFVVYEFMGWLLHSRAYTLLKGLGLIAVFSVVVAVLNLSTIRWMLGNLAPLAATALMIIFQPELRGALEQLGSRNFVARLFPMAETTRETGFTEKTNAELVRASFEMGRVRTGALIVIEQGQSLSDIERTGIAVDGLVSSQLLINIFEHNTPLHDGAVIIRGDRVAAATCYLPLSDNPDINKALGTRHRAAIGISENSDSVTIVVSEETGNVTVARAGRLERMENPEQLKALLKPLERKEESSGGKFRFWKDIRKDESKAVGQ